MSVRNTLASIVTNLTVMNMCSGPPLPSGLHIFWPKAISKFIVTSPFGVVANPVCSAQDALEDKVVGLINPK